ncbi:hypothetical protein CYMTET_35773 [Cymbomonas tetramitiformis]|uniref:Uncharacterized protein n=1 Tax=Cymbomonas tetramitiformis TaxID=36881 RepID=A0AAE0F8J3_9CHLO|nr:hypothetical protein CYMTET_35773 [Cymbomonas tetramitiformis]
MDRKLCKKLGRRWHGPLLVVERFTAICRRSYPRQSEGRRSLTGFSFPHTAWLIHDVFAQHRLKPHVGVEGCCDRRFVTPTPDPVMVDGQAEACVDKIRACRVRSSRGKQVEEWKLKEFEEERLRRQREYMQEVAERRRRLRAQTEGAAASAEVTLAEVIRHSCDETELPIPDEACLPREHLCMLDDRELARVTEADWGSERAVRILVLFNGTGSVEKQFSK